MALFGWSNRHQAALYTTKANRVKLEAEAARLLEAQNGNSMMEQDSNIRVPLFAAVSSGGTIRTKKG